MLRQDQRASGLGGADEGREVTFEVNSDNIRESDEVSITGERTRQQVLEEKRCTLPTIDLTIDMVTTIVETNIYH